MNARRPLAAAFAIADALAMALTPLALAMALTPLLAPVALHAAPDAFYTDRLRDGIQAYERNDFATAAKQLRLACFGLLDEPLPLAACLTRLAVAQAAAGDLDGFHETFRRIGEVEERFGTYGKADLPPEARAAFEQRVIATVPAATLDAMPAWKDLSRRKLEAQMAALAPRERRRALDDRLAKEPKNVILHLLLVELDLAEGKTAPAASRAEQAATLAPRDPWALCLRGLTRASAKRCGEALSDLETCPLSAHEPRYSKALQGCRVELAKATPPKPAPKATEIAPPGKPVGPLPATHAAAATSPAKPPPTVSSPQAGASSPQATAPSSQAGASPRLIGPSEREALDRSRRLLGAKGIADVKEARRLAGEVADAHPEWKEAQLLAGEAAYRNSQWKEAAAYFKRSGEIGDDQPEILFYLAVSLYETGDRAGAAQALKRSLPKLQSTPFVQSYVKRILGQ
jgi:hypothetical protein